MSDTLLNESFPFLVISINKICKWKEIAHKLFVFDFVRLPLIFDADFHFQIETTMVPGEIQFRKVLKVRANIHTASWKWKSSSCFGARLRMKI